MLRLSLRHNLERFIIMQIPGSLIVCGDYAGDLEAIAKVLNTFEFDQDWDKAERFVVGRWTYYNRSLSYR
jgi:hypothetical protein